MSEFVEVRFQTSRTVRINGAPQGQTNTVLRVQRAKHCFDLGAPQNYTPSEQWKLITGTTRERPAVIKFSLTQEAAESLSGFMSVIAQAIADREGEIDRLQAEIKTLTAAEQVLGASPPRARR